MRDGDPTGQPALRVEGLAVPFGPNPGLEEISFEVKSGERLVIVGASGEGKTTLLKAIAGILAPTRGSVEIGGRAMTREPPEKRGAVYLHQSPVLFPHLTVFENVAFPLRVRKVRGKELEDRVDRVLEAVQLSGQRERSAQALSGGQRHRVALARAVVARPTLLLLDEPLSSLDPRLRHEVRSAIVALQEEFRPALVLVTHDLEEAGILGDRIGVLLEGRLVEIAPPVELFHRPPSLQIARFLGFRNEFPGRVEADGSFRSALGVVRMEGGVWGGECGIAHVASGSAAAGVVPAVGVVPPGAARLAGGGETIPWRADTLSGAKLLQVEGVVERVSHPGPRTVAHVRVGEAAGKAPATLDADVLSESTPSPGSRVRVLVDLTRLCVFLEE